MTERRFPLLDGPSVPWEFMAPHERQAKRNHDQSLQTLASRGGLGPAEALAAVTGQRLDFIRATSDAVALPKLLALVEEWEAKRAGTLRFHGSWTDLATDVAALMVDHGATVDDCWSFLKRVGQPFRESEPNEEPR